MSDREDTIHATIHEAGNGFPDVGDYVPGTDGELYRVVKTSGHIHTSAPGAANYIYADVVLADWGDCADGDEHPSQCVIPSQIADDVPDDDDVWCPHCGRSDGRHDAGYSCGG